jgi:hypothetical protein
MVFLEFVGSILKTFVFLTIWHFISRAVGRYGVLGVT